MRKATTAEELAQALNDNEEYIDIEFDLSKKVLRIKAAGKVAWAIAIAAIGIAVYAAITTLGTGGTTVAFTGSAIAASSGAAVSILGLSATTMAINLAIAARSTNILTKLRKYKVIEESDDGIVLQRP